MTQWVPQHEVPRRSADGMVGVYCQTCHREICRRTNTLIRSVAKCMLCQLREQGVENPEKYVLPQYYMFDPTKPPVPVDAENEDVIVNMFPEEQGDIGRIPSSGGIAGTAKAIYRALGFIARKLVPEKSQATAAKRRRESSLFK
jgi:hypothetical protein